MASPAASNSAPRKRLSSSVSGEKVGDTDSIHSKHGRDGKHSQTLKPNPFYRKRIKTIVSTQRSIILRLPYRVTSALGLAFHNFNPRACLWVDKLYAERLFACFPESFKAKSQRTRDALLNVFRVRALDSRTLLLEEGGSANEVFIVLKGDVAFYRKTPKQEEIKVREREQLVGGHEVTEGAGPLERRGTTLTRHGGELLK